MFPYFDYQIIDNFFEQKNDENNFIQTESPIKSTTNDETPKHKVKEERLKKMPSLSMNQKEEIESNYIIII